MDIEQLAQEIRQFCEKNADAALAHKYERYFVEGYDAFGVPDERREQQRDAILASHRQALGLAGFLDLGDRLVRTGKYEEASLALGFIKSFQAEFTAGTLERLGGWLDDGICNWAHTDSISWDIIGPFINRGGAPLSALEGWRNAPSKWKRRSVPVSLIKSLGREIPIETLLEFIDPLMADGEKVVQQGLGWFLREAWKKHPPEVEGLLLKWKETCGRIIIQYATEKMTGEQRERFRRSKKTAKQ